uniref:Uncharacterized protein n=1 Tax=Globodera rostochiensis TaxID=31243 RepID=A0A914GVY3_GLORO
MIKHNAKRQSNYRIMKWWGKIVVLMNQLLSPSRVLFAKLGTSGSHQLNHCALLSCSKRRRCERHKSCQKGSSRPSSISSLTLNRISWALTLGVTVANASTMCTRQEDSDIAHMLYKCSEGTGQSMDTDGQRRIGRTYCINVN